MTLLRPHIVAAASIPRGATSGPVRPICVHVPTARRARGRRGGARAPCQDRDRPGARTTGSAHRRGQLSTFRRRLMIADLPAPASTVAGSERVRWFARGEG